jgi:hypothetical protein
MPAVPGLRHESTVAIGDREVTVISEVLLEPEGLLVTRVLDGATLLKKSHVALPATALADVAARGTSALAQTLSTHHLAFLRKLLARGEEDARAPDEALGAGTLGTLVLGPAGEVRQRVGEEQVPGGWLRAAFLVSGACRVLSERLSLGALAAGRIEGDRLRALLAPAGDEMRVRFHDHDRAPDQAPPRAAGGEGRR